MKFIPGCIYEHIDVVGRLWWKDSCSCHSQTKAYLDWETSFQLNYPKANKFNSVLFLAFWRRERICYSQWYYGQDRKGRASIWHTLQKRLLEQALGVWFMLFCFVFFNFNGGRRSPPNLYIGLKTGPLYSYTRRSPPDLYSYLVIMLPLAFWFKSCITV